VNAGDAITLARMTMKLSPDEQLRSKDIDTLKRYLRCIRTGVAVQSSGVE